jgi:hypothetical protein
MPTISVPGQGDVEFPDSMSEADITAALKKLAPPPAPQHGRLAEAAHKTAAFLPMAGGVAGGALGAGAGVGVASIATGALGAGLLGAAGKGLQHVIDSSLGYEKPPAAMDAAADTLGTGAREALGAGAGTLAAEGISAAARPLAPVLRGAAQATARRILRSTGGSLSAAKPLSSEAAQEVLDMGIIKPFGTSAGAAARLQAARSASGDAYSKIVSELEATGFTGPEAAALAQQYTAEGAAVGARSMNPAVPKAYTSAADQLAAKPTVNGRLGLKQAEDLKRSLQDQATSAYKQMQPGELARAHEDTAAMMRRAVEEEIAAQAAGPSVAPETKAIAAQFEPVKQQTGRLIEADNVAQAGMARAANRNLVSLPDLAAFAGEAAHSGNPVRGAGAALLMHLARTRGPSTAAAGLNFAAERLEDPASRILLRLGGGGGAPAGPSLLDILKQLRATRSQQQQE